MKATKAYIASLGTTGVLLAASILMLAVVSAVVAFDHWPGESVQSPAQTLVLSDKAPAIRVSAQASGPSATQSASRAGAPRGGAAPRSVRNDGGVAGQRFTSGRQGGGAPATTAPALPNVVPKAPAVPTPETILDPISNPGTTTSQVADGAQAITDQAGISVGRVSPDVGNAVVGTGQQVSQAIREIPLPQHIIPGY
jgi:hypothetical protein